MSPAGKSAAAGFTLVELLVVLAIAALLLLVAAPRLLGALPGAALRGAASDVAVALRRTQSQAIVANAERSFLVDVDSRRVVAGDEAGAFTLPAEIELRIVVGHTELAGAAAGGIRYFPDGSSTGGRVTLVQAGRAIDVRVDWLTGQVTLEGPHEAAR